MDKVLLTIAVVGLIGAAAVSIVGGTAWAAYFLEKWREHRKSRHDQHLGS